MNKPTVVTLYIGIALICLSGFLMHIVDWPNPWDVFWAIADVTATTVAVTSAIKLIRR